jgi:ureidoacrylate peracid hydrolase
MIYPLTPGRVALLVIDVQREYFDTSRPFFVPEAQTVLQRINQAIDAAKKAAAHVVYIRHEHRKSGVDVGRMADFGGEDVFGEGSPFAALESRMTVIEGSPIITKRRYSAFEGTELDQFLRGNGIDTVVISGFMTQFCCVSSARSAHDRDYRTVVLSDGIAGPDLPDVGFGKGDRKAIQAAILTSLANGVAEVLATSELQQRLKT